MLGAAGGAGGPLGGASRLPGGPGSPPDGGPGGGLKFCRASAKYISTQHGAHQQLSRTEPSYRHVIGPNTQQHVSTLAAKAARLVSGHGKACAVDVTH